MTMVRLAVAGLLALGLAACGSTKKPSDTPVVVTPAPVIQQAVKPPRSMVTPSVMPPAPSVYGGKGAGLTPEALLRHANDYGAWCQANAAKLKALEAFFWPEDK